MILKRELLIATSVRCSTFKGRVIEVAVVAEQNQGYRRQSAMPLFCGPSGE